MSELFFNAVKNKYRFPSKRGNLTTEQLFDLSCKELDEIYGELAERVDATPRKSLLSPRTKADSELEDMAEIVKRVFEYKESVRERIEKAQETRQKKQRLLDILAEKRDDALKNMTEEELLKKLRELGEVD